MLDLEKRVNKAINLTAFPWPFLRFNATLPQKIPLQSRKLWRRYKANEIVQEFKLDLRNGITINSNLSESEISNIPDVNGRNLGNGYVWYALSPIEIGGEAIIFSLCFFQSKIQMLNVSVVNPDKYGSSWNDFSEAKEKLRAKDTEKWLSNIGYKSVNFHGVKFGQGMIQKLDQGMQLFAIPSYNKSLKHRTFGAGQFFTSPFLWFCCAKVFHKTAT